jgi:hypothetical protein
MRLWMTVKFFELECGTHLTESKVAKGGGKVTCPFGQKRDGDQYPERKYRSKSVHECDS